MNKHERNGLRRIVTDHQRAYLRELGKDPAATPDPAIMYALQSDYRIFRDILDWTDVKISDYIEDVRQDLLRETSEWSGFKV